MFAVIYSFKTQPDKVEDFKKAWKELTELIYEYEGSLGSRLHKKEPNHYIAYAQWPSKDKWKNSGSKLPVQAKQASKNMKDSCFEIKTLHELEVEIDLLKGS